MSYCRESNSESFRSDRNMKVRRQEYGITMTNFNVKRKQVLFNKRIHYIKFINISACDLDTYYYVHQFMVMF
jgi:hypothetical protein